MPTYQDFDLAKQKLNKIFLGIQDYGASASEHLNGNYYYCTSLLLKWN